jgi:sec-independent protein translocase protein TatC
VKIGAGPDDREMPITEHLAELRSRLWVVVAAFFACFIAGYFLSRPVLYWLVRRSDLHHLIVTGVAEAFYGVIEVDVVLCLIAVSPLLLYEVAAFVFPGLTATEKRMVALFTAPGLLLFLAGVAAGFFWFVPILLRVMLSFTGHGILPFWTLSNYLSFVIDLSVPFGFVAEMPLLSGVLAYLGILDPALLARFRRYAILVAFLVAAILAPPTALSMILMAVPFYFIYELSCAVAQLAVRTRGRRASPPVS